MTQRDTAHLQVVQAMADHASSGWRQRLRMRLILLMMNWYPAYRGTGGRLVFVSANQQYVRVRLPLSWRTRNYVGTVFGGSMFASVDPIYMVMLIRVLGREYVVWDKSARIRFRRPARSTLTADFAIDDEELALIRDSLVDAEHIEREYQVDLVDENGTVCAEVHKLLYIRRKDAKRSVEQSG